MTVYCQFTESRTNVKLFINPALVRAVKPAEFVNNGAQIVFDATHTLTVHDTIENVVKALEAAGKRD